MTFYLDHLPGIDTWKELGSALPPRALAHDVPLRVLLLRMEGSIALLEQPESWRARHRRGLHRLGFRSRPTYKGMLWEWAPNEEAVRDEVRRSSDLSHQPDNPVVQRLCLLRSRDRLIGARCVVVLRDVFALAPTHLCLVTLINDEDEWDEVG